jgi:hypothetical protein
VEDGNALTGSGNEAAAVLDVVADEVSGGLLMGAGAVIVVVVCVVDWAVGSLVAAGGRPVVCTCSLHPHRNSPINALAAAIWIFRIGFIFVIPYFRLNRGVTEP